MKRLLPVLMVFGVFLGSSTYCYGQLGNDKDWNISFYANCELPNNSMQWMEEGENKFVRFQLIDKDYGGCRSDRKAGTFAPYWERAELKQRSKLSKNKKYEVSFNVRFVQGFSQGANKKRSLILQGWETFFQIHAWTSPTCYYAPIMLGISGGAVSLFALRTKQRHVRHYSNTFVTDLLGAWNDWTFVFDTSPEPKITVFLNDQRIFSNIPFFIPSCGIPHFKFGIYRPGNESGNPHSIVDFDKINLRTIKENIWTYCLNPAGENTSQDLYRVSDNCKSGHEEISHWRYKRLDTTPGCWSEKEKKAYKNINFCEGNDKALSRLRYRSLMSKKERPDTDPAPKIRTNYCYISELNTLTKTTVPYCANGIMVNLEEGEALVKKGRNR